MNKYACGLVSETIMLILLVIINLPFSIISTDAIVPSGRVSIKEQEYNIMHVHTTIFLSRPGEVIIIIKMIKSI